MSHRFARLPRAASRRAFLRFGSLAGLGMMAPRLFAGHGSSSPKPLRSCVVAFFYGGPSHLDTWDMKPDAPAEVRGEYQPIATGVPGFWISEHLPRMARLADRLTVIRSMHHGMRNHNSAAVEALCGRTPLRGDLELLADDALSFPCLGACVSYLAQSQSVPLTAVALPHVMYNVVRLPGQTAGLLGARYNPLQIEDDPTRPGFGAGLLRLPAEVSTERLDGRARLLGRLESGESGRAASPAMQPYYDKAFDLLHSDNVHRAFAIDREPEAVRERFGRHRLGQSLLLARRLVEAQVPFITVYDGIHNGQEANWDSHVNLFPRHRQLIPPADQALSALIEDLHDRGLLDSTLVVAMGEFGRTPQINTSAGRDHWPDCYSIVMAGGGVRAGYLHGASDKIGAYPADSPMTPGDLAATLFWRFGLDHQVEIHDATGRPYPIAAGQPVTTLFERV